MIKVTVKTILGMDKYLGNKLSQEIELKENSTVKELISIMANIYGESIISLLLTEDNTPKRGIAMFLNGRNIFARDGLKTILKDRDEFLIFPPVGGG
ncbi:MoaD/ThiS family protein [Maledivibacter halophilus]|uniref:ThiS family protein n=1 Tax=Maledivibacter halophilus TaxID=36842 RepID=A0A1T5M889_9FIRM|nr:MoaD/ThiS family protein [Maledivibacter halophilus]SKC84461.1 ThiS family protein [Maledivibacter halophilus]